jgi:hypothetical protein
MITSLSFGENIMRGFNKYPSHARIAICKEIERISDELTRYSEGELDMTEVNRQKKAARETGIGLTAAILNKMQYIGNHGKTLYGGEGRRGLDPVIEDIEIVVDIKHNEKGARQLIIKIKVDGLEEIVASDDIDRRNYFDKTFGAYWYVIRCKNFMASNGRLSNLEAIDTARRITHNSAARRIESLIAIETGYMLPAPIAKTIFTLIATLYPTHDNVLLRDIVRYARGKDLRLSF